MSFHKEYYLINVLLLMAKFSIHKYGDYKPLFLILKSEIKLLRVLRYANMFLCSYFIVILYLFSPLDIVLCWIWEIQ